MNWQEFEDRLQAQAQAHQTPVDTDALWNKIRAKKRRRWPLFWLFVGLGVLSGSGWLATVWFSGNNPLHSVKTTAVMPTDTVNYHKNLSARKIDSVYFTRRTNVHDSIKTSANKESTINGDAPRLLKAVPIPSLASKYFIAPTAANKSLLTVKDYTHDSSISRSSIKTVNGRIAAAVTAANKIISTEIEPNKFLLRETLNFMPGNTAKDSSNALSENNKLPIPTDSFSMISRTPLPWMPTRFTPLFPSRLDQPISPVLTPAAEKKTTKNPNRLYIGLQAGYYHWRIRADSTRIGEKPVAATQAGWQMQLPMGQFWSLRTGIQYRQFVSVFRWTRQWAEVRETPVLSYYVNGNIDTTFSTTLYRYERKVQHYNRLRSISIPLDVQYRIPMKHWTVCPAAGLQIQVWQQARGIVLNNAVPDAELYPAIYDHAFNVGVRFGLSLEVPLGQRTRFVVEPAIMMNLARRTKAAYAAERFQQWGVNIGLVRQW